ncbi:hypothetical protein SYYSPA8_01375 [Streptomyces yaizuensis]|uniref:Uncharacterized protein n=1 Tax=Streptomyces yaizuensis TaxID=2989713 RepID=A0ABQ5NR91_9ACTN|nr:hypothetical protein SYYSPA8_01375 [Streptomyces sp. YSPA8]
MFLSDIDDDGYPGLEPDDEDDACPLCGYWICSCDQGIGE